MINASPIPVLDEQPPQSAIDPATDKIIRSDKLCRKAFQALYHLIYSRLQAGHNGEANLNLRFKNNRLDGVKFTEEGHMTREGS